MHTPTFLQKTSPGRRTWRAFLPLLLLFVSLGSSHSALAQQFQGDNLTVAASATNSTTTSSVYVGKSGGGTQFNGRDLGKGTQFDQNTGKLAITSAFARFQPGEFDPDKGGPPYTPITSASLFYRVYSNVTAITARPGYTEIPFNLITSNNDGGNIGDDVSYSANNLDVDLLHQPTVLGGGTYVVEIYFQGIYKSSIGTDTLFDRFNASGAYKATFKVVPPAVTPSGGITTWISTSNTADGVNWLNAANWSNGVPTRFSDAILPAKTAVNPTSSPLLGDPTATYEVRTITLNGTTNSTRALLRIGQSTSGGSPVGATLRVYGDLNNYSGGILASVIGPDKSVNPLTNSTIVLARADGGFQIVRGALDVIDVRIEGTGIKAVINEIDVRNSFTFATDPNGPGAIVQTSNDDGAKDPATGLTISTPTLEVGPTSNTTKTTKVDLKDSGFLYGETNTSYIRGITLADRALRADTKQPFGNIGIDITSDRDVLSSNVIITRTVGDPFFGPLGSTSTAPTGSPQPVKRQYGISGGVNNITTSTVAFHYLNSVDELNGNPEENLTIFKTSNNGPPFTLVGRTGTVDLVNHVVIRENYSGSLNTITMGDEFNPLPVVLTAFNATRSGLNTKVTWATASEKNSAGFEVQVSTDGAYFRKLGFVNSQNGNSTKSQNYSFLDTEANKAGVRYYRLRQVDTDGREDFSPVRAVDFSAAAEGLATALSAYPNPYNTSDAVKLSVQTSSAGAAHLRVTDLMGRVVANQTFTTVSGVTEVALDQAASLNAGSYLAQVTLPSGEVKTVRIQKH